MNNIINLTRPHQWFKNCFVFLPLFFNGQFTNADLLFKCVMAFFAFNFLASSIYCFNDICDAKADRLHPKKCNRPIASGAVSKRTAYIVMAILFIASLCISYIFLHDNLHKVIGIIIFYYILNIAYCIYLKHKVLIDVFIIAVGFVLRVFMGGVSTGIALSHWIVIMTFLLALFLALAKRRDDVVIFDSTGVKVRKNINRYNLTFINQAISIVSTITFGTYIIYTLSADVIANFGSPYIYFTSVFVLLGILRYIQLTVVDLKSGSPTNILMHDSFTQLCLIGWFATFCVILYF